MGQYRTQVNMPIPTKIGSKMGGAPKPPKWYPKTVLIHGQIGQAPNHPPQAEDAAAGPDAEPGDSAEGDREDNGAEAQGSRKETERERSSMRPSRKKKLSPRLTWKLPPLWKTWFHSQDRPSGSLHVSLRECKSNNDPGSK